MKRFALIGAAGYIAPRHMKAIKDTSNTLVAALDCSDSVGIIDSYFPDARFFTEFERFDRHIDKLKRSNDDTAIDYVSICSPNYLHDAHARFACRSDAHAICEKPLVLNPWNLDGLKEIEESTGKRIYNILQLRLHPSLITLKETLSGQTDKIHDVDLTYITSRGNWYLSSWKGDPAKSGGIATNIGVHFFDMLHWLFGRVLHSELHQYNDLKASGYIEFSSARVRWHLSIDASDLPNELAASNQRTYRSIKIDGQEVEFSTGFTDLHTESYKQILTGNGFGIDDTRAAITLVHNIRNMRITSESDFAHPLARKR